MAKEPRLITYDPVKSLIGYVCAERLIAVKSGQSI
jgi:hypothetical protein